MNIFYKIILVLLVISLFGHAKGNYWAPINGIIIWYLAYQLGSFKNCKRN